MSSMYGYGAYSATYRYEPIRRTARKKTLCQGGCGRKLDRQRTFTQTINPFNRNPDGTPRNYRQVWASLGEECEAWQPEATCKNCLVDQEG